jgi:hypothetical protein
MRSVNVNFNQLATRAFYCTFVSPKYKSKFASEDCLMSSGRTRKLRYAAVGRWERMKSYVKSSKLHDSTGFSHFFFSSFVSTLFHLLTVLCTDSNAPNESLIEK